MARLRQRPILSSEAELCLKRQRGQRAVERDAARTLQRRQHPRRCGGQHVAGRSDDHVSTKLPAILLWPQQGTACQRRPACAHNPHDVQSYLRADNKASAEKEIMTTVSKQIFGAAIAAVSIATPALAQHASQSDALISAHHRQHLRVSSPPSDTPAFTSPPRDPRSWVGDPASRPYHYDPGWGGGP
jgi:hypothetical protein